MIEKIDLSEYSYVFSEKELSDIQPKNFFYGKNGTGKSSLTNAIINQYGDSHDIRIFNGWRDIIGSNDNLNSIVLGTKNKDISFEIEKIDQSIFDINNELLEPDDAEYTDNLFVKKRKAEESWKIHKNKMEKFYTNSAREITKNLSLGREYYKNKFKDDINEANYLSKEELINNRATIHTTNKSPLPKLILPRINLETHIARVNEIITRNIRPSGIIKELEDNISKQNFAKAGMKIHERNSNETCAFCGNIIEENRWQELDNYFTDAIIKFEDQVKYEIDIIQEKITQVNELTKISHDDFYPVFTNQITKLNECILETKDYYIIALNKLISILKEKKNNLYKEFNKMSFDDIPNFKDIQQMFNYIYDENDNYSNKLAEKKEEARYRIRLHEVKNKLTEFNFSDNRKELIKRETILNEYIEDYNEKQEEKRGYERRRLELVEQSKDETSSVKNINKLLKGLGNNSFSLEFKNTKNEQKGQYFIKSHCGLERSIQTLSDGEKNIVAFLWFMNDIKDISKATEKDKVVIFDDPMTSNDDNCQYLIMGVIQKFYQEQNHPQLFLFTHNNHFYLHTTPNRKKYPTREKPITSQKYIHLIKVDNKTIIKIIKNRTEELMPIYDELWAELKFAYNHDKPIFMWNNMRRILETYNRFNFKEKSPSDIEKNLEDLNDKTLAVALVKSLNVNSHIGYQTDIDISGKTKEELKNVFSDIFNMLDAEKHFSRYWG